MTGDTVPITELQAEAARYLQEAMDRVLYTGHYEKVKLPWWKALLRRRRYDRVYHNPLFEAILRPRVVGAEPLTWQQVVIDRLTDQSVPDD